MTTQANTPLNTGEMIFKDLVWNILVKLGLASFFAAVTVVNFWPVNAILIYLVNKYSDELFALFKLIVDVEAIAFVNAEHKAAYQAQALKLKVLVHDKGIDSADYKKARDDAKVILSQYVQFGR